MQLCILYDKHINRHALVNTSHNITYYIITHVVILHYPLYLSNILTNSIQKRLTGKPTTLK